MSTPRTLAKLTSRARVRPDLPDPDLAIDFQSPELSPELARARVGFLLARMRYDGRRNGRADKVRATVAAIVADIVAGRAKEPVWWLVGGVAAHVGDEDARTLFEQALDAHRTSRPGRPPVAFTRAKAQIDLALQRGQGQGFDDDVRVRDAAWEASDLWLRAEGYGEGPVVQFITRHFNRTGATGSTIKDRLRVMRRDRERRALEPVEAVAASGF